LLGQISSDDIAEILGFVRENCPRELQRALQYDLLMLWSETDPRAAIDYASKIPNEAERQMALNIIIAGWSVKEPEAAIEWTKQLPPGALRGRLIGEIISALAPSDPERALNLFQNSRAESFGSLPSRFSYEIFRAWAAKNPVEAASKAAQLRLTDDRAGAYRAIASTWGMNDPRTALAWASNLPSSSDKRDVVVNILSQWVQNDSAAASEWLQQMPNGPNKRKSN
jgi:hypothetical protein